MEASYYDSIMEQQRLEPEFFRVGFYGRKFPFFLRVSPSAVPGPPRSAGSWTACPALFVSSPCSLVS